MIKQDSMPFIFILVTCSTKFILCLKRVFFNIKQNWIEPWKRQYCKAVVIDQEIQLVAKKIKTFFLLPVNKAAKHN